MIATSDQENTPAAAVVLFAENDDLSIIFGTHPTRKYRNLKANPKAAIVMTRDFVAVQLHGIARELQGQEAIAAQKQFMAKHPEADQHMMAGSVFFSFTPNWIRYLDTGAKPPKTFESAVS